MKQNEIVTHAHLSLTLKATLIPEIIHVMYHHINIYTNNLI